MHINWAVFSLFQLYIRKLAWIFVFQCSYSVYHLWLNYIRPHSRISLHSNQELWHYLEVLFFESLYFFIWVPTRGIRVLVKLFIKSYNLNKLIWHIIIRRHVNRSFHPGTNSRLSFEQFNSQGTIFFPKSKARRPYFQKVALFPKNTTD